MNKKAVFHVLGLLLLGLAAVLLVPLAVALIFRTAGGVAQAEQVAQAAEWRAFLYASLICAAVGASLHFALRNHGQALRPSEGFGIVTLGWVVISAFGALPFYFAEIGLSYSDCYFETMSGFTTTGATIITATKEYLPDGIEYLPNGIESLPAGIGFWRCMTQWLGGMGIVLLTVAILPLLGAGGYQLYRAEVPGPTKDRLTPRIRETALTLWKVYLFLTVAETFLLMFTGLSLYDALCHSFTTLASGGFSPRNASVGAYGPLTQWVVMVFMFLAGINFVVHYRAMFLAEPLGYVRREEIRWYVVLILVIAALLFVNIYGGTYPVGGGREEESFKGVEKTIRTTLFTAVTIITTTGFTNADFNAWPAMSRMVLLLAMFIGGCAGSTAGGIKIMRVMVIWRYAWREVRHLFLPRAVIPVKIEGRSVDRDVLTGIAGFFFLWMILVAVCSILLAGLLDGARFAADDSRLLTALSAVISAIGNIGPALADVGPYANYAEIPPAGKWLLTLLMLLGRLEIYGVLILLLPATWRR